MATEAVLDGRPAALEPKLGGFGTGAPRRTARILIVDDEAIVRFGLRQLFAGIPELAVVGEAVRLGTAEEPAVERERAAEVRAREHREELRRHRGSFPGGNLRREISGGESPMAAEGNLPLGRWARKFSLRENFQRKFPPGKLPPALSKRRPHMSSEEDRRAGARPAWPQRTRPAPARAR